MVKRACFTLTNTDYNIKQGQGSGKAIIELTEWFK